jgi:hypothetical protein
MISCPENNETYNKILLYKQSTEISMKDEKY